MQISDIRVKLIQDAADRLKAVCTITLDDEFVVRDLKVVEGTNGLFVAMPSRKLSVHCPQCRGKNHLRAKFCNDCGAKLPPARVPADPAGRVRLHRDIAHPTNPAFRELIQSSVIEKYQAELVLASDPDYQPIDIDKDMEEDLDEPNGNQAISEYDQLIAGLRGGIRERGSTAAPRHERPADRGSDRPPPRRDGQRAPRPPRPERGAAPRPQPPRREQDQRAGDRHRGRGPEPARRTPAPVISLEDDGDEAPPVRPEQTTPAIQKSEQRPAPAPHRIEPPPTDDSGDAPFGAGIL